MCKQYFTDVELVLAILDQSSGFSKYGLASESVIR